MIELFLTARLSCVEGAGSRLFCTGHARETREEEKKKKE